VAGILQKVLDRAIQVHGALGLTDATLLSYWYRHERGRESMMDRRSAQGGSCQERAAKVRRGRIDSEEKTDFPFVIFHFHLSFFDFTSCDLVDRIAFTRKLIHEITPRRKQK